MSASRRQPAKPGAQRSPHVSRETEWTEIPIFIHGIMPDKNPTMCRKEYGTLRTRLETALKNFPKKDFHGFVGEIPVVWGRPDDKPSPELTEQYLSEVERKLDSLVERDMGSAYGGLFGIHGAIRNWIFYGVADLIYYVSADGENSVRNRVFRDIAGEIAARDSNSTARFSLTIFGHSAGSLIAHDLLYHLFLKEAPESETDSLRSDMNKLRRMVAHHRLRIRRLYTFGSPITPMLLRANSLIQKFVREKKLSPATLGFHPGDGLGNPRWVNFWTPNDVASYPVGFLYDNTGQVIEDRKISSSLNPVEAHGAYWGKQEMIDYIARTL